MNIAFCICIYCLKGGNIMSEYKRLISYLYAYDAGVKTINVGFAKAELRGGILKLSVVLKNVMFVENKISLSFFSKLDNQWIRTLISDIDLNNGQGELHIRLSEEELIAQNIIFNNISGIIITENNNDDYVVMSLWQEISVSPYDILSKAEKVCDNNIISNDNYDCSLENDNTNYSDSSSDNKEIIYEAAVMEEDNIFGDNTFYELKKIKPEELKEYKASALETSINNSFLMHGYYNYDHILIGKKYDNEKDEELIMIGVPGIFHEKEQFMASIFGFPEFKEIKDISQVEYNGYWYKMLSV